MFKNPFSFDGRIRRTEYGVSLIIYVVVVVIINAIMASSEDTRFFGLAYIPMLWFLWAQGAKRCHDLGNNGWWQIIPFYPLWLLFQDGQPVANQYGENPKDIQSIGGSQITGNSGSGYQGGYTGGHNTQNTNYSTTEKQPKTDGYNDGDLYK